MSKCLKLIVILLCFIPVIAFGQQEKRPTRVDLVPQFEKLGLIARDQGKRDTCSSFAITALAEFEFNQTRPNDVVRLSEEFLVWAANDSTGLRADQAMFYEAVHGLNAAGISADQQCPYETSAAKRPGKEAIENAKQLSGCWRVHWIKRWDTTKPLSEAQFFEIQDALAAGHPVACGLRWPKQDQGASILRTPAAGDVYDGHSIVLIGYQDDTRRRGAGVFGFRNSFGPKWGNNGYGVMSYDYVRRYANDAMWLEYDPNLAKLPVITVEGESMNVLQNSRCDANPQSCRNFGAGMWSNAEHLLCRAEKGGRIDLEFNVKEAGSYQVELLATTAPDFGSIRVAIDGKASPDRFDLYSGRVAPTGKLTLGEFALTAGAHRLQILADEKHPSSKGYFFGVDAIELVAVDKDQ